MTQKRTAKIRTRADYGSGMSGFAPNYGFVFSSNISDWQHSKRLKANLHMREVYAKLKPK